MELFDWQRKLLTDKTAPLAARMRPRTLDEFIGQDAIVGPGRLLRRAIQADRLSSVIFHGPPGTGKTTLARIIANTTKAEFTAINAVLAGVKDIREAIAQAKTRLGQHSRRTILFVDEVHRFNKSQQDALLPWVENGTVILVGATTENPYFEVNKALVSRSRLFRLQSLDADDLRAVVAQALSDVERGYGGKPISIADEALDHLSNVANGDARAILNAIELAVETTPPDANESIHITLAVAEESIQQRAVLYDKEGDAHFDAISAFIKSCRGSDADAALYWLARMVYAGEDPRYILRRMIILASEDVGLADPDVLCRVMACSEAFDRVGLPEGRFHLSQAALVLATAPKSNSTMGFFDALKVIREEREAEVPNHLKDSKRDAEGFGHGEGYLYPHAYKDHWVEQQYLPGTLRGQIFYQPSDTGFESTIRNEVARRREARLAAIDQGPNEPLGLTYGPPDPGLEQWLARASEAGGRQLEEVRDELFGRAELSRHHTVLDLRADDGLLLFEAIRRVPEGGVFGIACIDQAQISDRAKILPSILKPEIVAAASQLQKDLHFDRVVGMNLGNTLGEITAGFDVARDRLVPGGKLVVAQVVPRSTQRLYALAAGLQTTLLDSWRTAEESLYDDSDDPKLSWNHKDLGAALTARGFEHELECRVLERKMKISSDVLDWWFAPEGTNFFSRLRERLTASDAESIRQHARTAWIDRTVAWQTQFVFIVGRPRTHQ